MNARRVSDSTIRRLSLYLNLLRELSAAGTDLVPSAQLASGFEISVAVDIDPE